MSNRRITVNSAFAALNATPAKIPQRGIVYTADSRIALCALSSNACSGRRGFQRCWSALRDSSRQLLEDVARSGGQAFVAFEAPGARFLFPWEFVSRLIATDNSWGRDPIVIELAPTGNFALVARGVRTNIDQYRLQASTAEAA